MHLLDIELTNAADFMERSQDGECDLLPIAPLPLFEEKLIGLQPDTHDRILLIPPNGHRDIGCRASLFQAVLRPRQAGIETPLAETYGNDHTAGQILFILLRRGRKNRIVAVATA